MERNGTAAVQRIWVYEYLSGGGPLDDAATRAALLPAGLAMRDAMAADLMRLPHCDVTVASAPDCPAPPGRAARLAPHPGESAPDFVARGAAAHDLVWLVAPETGGLLEQLQRGVGAARWLGCAADALAVAASKSATTLRLAAHGLWTPLAFADDPRTRQWVVKPDDGAGAVATRRFDGRSAARAELARRSVAGEAVVLEPWVDGDALSLSLMCGPDTAELLSVNRQEIVVDAAGTVGFDGVALDVIAPSDPRRTQLAQLARRVHDAVPGLRGYVGIDLVWHPAAGPVIVEINPRVTSAYVGLSAALGRNLAAAVIASCAPQDVLDAVR